MTPGFLHRDRAARNAEPDDAAFHQLYGAGGPSSPGLPGASVTGSESARRFSFFVFRANRRLPPRAPPPKRRTSVSSCAASEGSRVPPQPHVNDQSAFRSSSQSGHMQTAYHSQGMRRTLPLEKPRGGSQEKTAPSSVSERNEIADSEYCRSPQSPRRTRTRFHSGKTASKMVEGLPRAASA